VVTAGVLILTGALILGACGGSSDNDAATTVSGSPTATTAPNAAVTTIEPDEDSGVIASGSAADRCNALFTTSEMTDLFGEEAILDEAETEEGIGQLICVWSTVEDPNDLTDLSYDLLVLQLYGGDPIPGENFFDVSFYPDAQPLDGIGAQAFLDKTAPNNLTVHFLEGKTYGQISYVEANPDSPGGAAGLTDAQAINLLTTFHDRVP